MSGEHLAGEPVRHRLWLVLTCLSTLNTVPWPFIGQETTWWGPLPAWLWWTLAMTAVTSCLCAWGLLRLWRSDDAG